MAVEWLWSYGGACWGLSVTIVIFKTIYDLVVNALLERC